MHPKAKVLGRHGGVRWLGVAVGEEASSRPPHFECSVFEHSSMNLMAIEWASLPVCCLSSVARPSATALRQQPLNDYENSWQPARNDLSELLPHRWCMCMCVCVRVVCSWAAATGHAQIIFKCFLALKTLRGVCLGRAFKMAGKAKGRKTIKREMKE